MGAGPLRGSSLDPFYTERTVTPAARANLEAGAATIWEYQQTFVAGLLQTPEFVRSRVDREVTLKPGNPNADGALAGRVGRQRMPRRPGGPTYEIIIDEVAVCRLAVPYTYPDPGDPSVVAVDTVTSDLILTGAAGVHPCEALCRRCRKRPCRPTAARTC